jgi:hypothetical protein
MREVRSSLFAITRYGKPIAEIISPALVINRKVWIISMKHSLGITGDIMSPADNRDERKALRD